MYSKPENYCEPQDMSRPKRYQLVPPFLSPITSSVWQRLGEALCWRGDSALSCSGYSFSQICLPVCTPNGWACFPATVVSSPRPWGLVTCVLDFSLTPTCSLLGHLGSWGKAAASWRKSLGFHQDKCGLVFSPGSYESDGLNAVLMRRVVSEMLSRFFLQNFLYRILGDLT